MSKERIKLRVISIEVSEENQIVPIDFKLANDIDSCKGIFVTVKEYLDTPSIHIPQIGELSLMFNAKTKHPIHLTAEYTKSPFHKKEFLDLNCKIEPNANITGFYTDYGKTKNRENLFLPYTLVIYMACNSIESNLTK
jgi:hypothetical protein